MAPYTIAHLKLSMALKETGFLYFNETRTGKARLGIYLTNSLEDVNKQPELLAFDFGASIAEEAKAASKIKNEKPIMVIVGNPPYSVSSSNKGEWIQNLIKDYKQNLNERKINLDDDYIKFIRFAEYFIEKNKTGIVAMITNNSFIDGITHRQMRKHLLETFDDIYILNLHGNSNIKERSPDGGKDENIFDIQQGVSINIFVRKNENKNKLGVIYYSELFGKREDKFNALNSSDLIKIKWLKLNYTEPYFFFVPKNFGLEEEYRKGIYLPDLFLVSNTGIQTKRDSLVIQIEKNKIVELINDFELLNEGEIRSKYSLRKDGRDWSVSWAKKDIINNNPQVIEIDYRPFDKRYTVYTGKTKGIIAYPRESISKHLIGKNNYSLALKRQAKFDFSYALIHPRISESCLFESAYANNSEFPLYLYNFDGVKTSNLKNEIVGKIENIIGNTLPEDIFDYIYAVLYSPKYRQKYKEFLKIDFPRVPYPKDTESFKQLVKYGTELRQLHLLESPKVNKFITTYPESGTDAVEKPVYKDEKVYINDKQYFGNVPEVAWNFYIGGYQPAQKWLKDRKGRVLTNEDLEHYQKMIVALVETDKIMTKIDTI